MSVLLRRLHDPVYGNQCWNSSVHISHGTHKISVQKLLDFPDFVFMRTQHLIPSPNMLSNMHVYYQGDFLTETEASQFMHNSLLSQVNQQRNAAVSRISNTSTRMPIKRPVSATSLSSSRNNHKGTEGADQGVLDMESMVDDLKFLRASIMDTDGNLLLKDGVNDTSSATYRKLEQLVRRRPASAGTGLDSNTGKYTIRDVQVLRNNNFYDLLPEAQRDLLDSNMRVDFSLFTNEKAQKELNDSINFINKGLDLEAASHGMTEDVLSTYRRRRPASAHCITTRGLLSPHGASLSIQHSKTSSRPMSMRRTSVTRVQDLQDRLHDFASNDTQSRCCFGDTYNSITQGHHPIIIASELPVALDQKSLTDTLTTSILDIKQTETVNEEVVTAALDQNPSYYNAIHVDLATTFPDHQRDQVHDADTYILKSGEELSNSLVYSEIHPPPSSIPKPHQAQGPSSNNSTEYKVDLIVESNYSQAKPDHPTSTTDELSVDSEGNIYAVIGKKRASSHISPEMGVTNQEQNGFALADNAAENHGEVILDEEIFETICSQHSTQSSAIESSLNASLTKIPTMRNATRARPYHKSGTKYHDHNHKNAAVTFEESNFRQLLHSDKRFPMSFQPKTTHVAASHSTLDISEGPIEVRRIWRPPHSAGRPAPTPRVDNLDTVRDVTKSTPDVYHSEHGDTSTESASRLDRRIIVPERQGFKGSIITSYQRAIANRNKEISEKDAKAASVSEHVVDLKRVYGGLNIDKSSFSMESSAPLMTIKATIPYTANQQPQKQLIEQALEGSSEAIAPIEPSAGDFQGMEAELQALSHPTPPQCSQVDAYPIQGSIEYSGKKEDMEDVVDLPEESSNAQSISCLINSQLQRSDLEASLVIPRMDLARNLERSADVLGSMIGETSICSDEPSQRGKIVLRRGSGPREDSARRLSSTDQTSKDQSLYERMQDFRETVKQELSQQASFSALASKRRSSLTIPTDFEDLPPQTFIDTTVIPLQKRLDEAIAAAMSRKPKLPADESDTLANYIEIDDDKTDDRAATPTMEALYSQQETPRPGDFSVVTEHVPCPEVQCISSPEHADNIAVAEDEPEHFAVSHSDTQKPCVDTNYVASPGYPSEPRQTVIRIVDLEDPISTEIETCLRDDHEPIVPTEHSISDLGQNLKLSTKPVGIKELAHIDQLLRDAKRLNNSLQTSLYKDQPSELPADYEAKMVLDDYELDANFPILEEAESGIDPTGEQDVILANYKRLAMDAAQKRSLRFDVHSADLGREYSTSGKSQVEEPTESNLGETKASEVKWADTAFGDQKPKSKSNESRQVDRIASGNWRMFAGQGSSVASTMQTHKRASSYTISTSLATSQSARYDSQQRKPYNKFEKFTPRQFLSSASMSQTFKPDRDISGLGLSTTNHSIAPDITVSGPQYTIDSSTTTLHSTLPFQSEAVKDKFNHVASCVRSLLMTQDLDKSSIVEQHAIQTLENGTQDPDIQFYTSFNGTSSKANHLTISGGETMPPESAHSPGPKPPRTSASGTSSAQSAASSAITHSTRIKSAAISKLVKEITSVNSTTMANLARTGYSKSKLESSRDNTRYRNTSKCNEKLEKAALLLDKPRQKTRRISSAMQSESLSESISGYVAPHDNYSALDDPSESQAIRLVSNPKGAVFVSAGLSNTTDQQPRLLSSKATYETQTVRIGNSAKIRTRTIHPERPVALKADSDAALLRITPVTMTQPSKLPPGRPESGPLQSGKMKVADTRTRIGRQSQEILANSSHANARPYYGSSALFRSVDDMIVVTPSPATRNMVTNMKNRSSVDSVGQEDNSKITRPTSSRHDRQSAITSPAVPTSLLLKRPRSAIASSTRESISKTDKHIANDLDDSSASLFLQRSDLGLEPISIMAKPLAVQSPERILNDPYDVHGTLRDETERFIPCRGFRVSSAGKLRLPSTIEKDIVVNIRPLTAKVSVTARM